ncbi:STAS domain-containing protein [Phenylobacterium sp.]|uniref:STAS domain-containing protein n=1 Tax=Phenylobacterium sp. TaxID=1871053 RepID=UPI0025DED6CA|nr:STAS domain-containing protein [Phenylobacterium sp.]
MKWTDETLPDKVVGKVEGRIYEATWEAFANQMIGGVRKARDAGLSLLVVDLTKLDYMSSRGLRALTLASREAVKPEAVTIILAAPNDQMREILEISRYDKIFKVVDNVAAAVPG